MKAEDFSEIQFNFQYFGDKIELNQLIETHIYRIIQELINNILKHSRAKEAFIEIKYHHPEIKITVWDDGIGFLTQEISKGIGLNNIDSRVRFLNADFKKLETQKGSWFIIVISFHKIPDL